MKKKKSGGGANWMDTYGDMVTLLLCFFVLLYSLSTISEEAWKNLVQSFNPQAVMTGESQGGGGPSDDGDKSGAAPEPVDPPEDVTQVEIEQDMEQLFQAIQTYISEAGVTESVSVSKDGGKIYISFSGTAFFKGNSYALTAEALPVLDSMSEMLSSVARSIDEVRVIGHTAQYSADTPNNPETDFLLSGDRAGKVVSYIINHTRNEVLDPAKLVSEGRGQWQPVAPNDTEAGKSQNRRVEMIVSGRDLEKELAGSDGVESYYTEGQAPNISTTDPANPEGSAIPEYSTDPDSSASPESSTSPGSTESPDSTADTAGAGSTASPDGLAANGS